MGVLQVHTDAVSEPGWAVHLISLSCHAKQLSVMTFDRERILGAILRAHGQIGQRRIATGEEGKRSRQSKGDEHDVTA